MAQWVKLLAVKPDDLNWIPQGPYGRRRAPTPKVVLTFTNMHSAHTITERMREGRTGGERER